MGRRPPVSLLISRAADRQSGAPYQRPRITEESSFRAVGISALLVVSLLAGCSSNEPGAGRGAAAGAGGDSSSAASFRDPLAAGGDTVFFDLDQSVIRQDARATLDAQAEWLNRNKAVLVTIAGDCDERGTEEYNLALGNRRAFAAASYLTIKGVASSRIETLSYGKDRPIAPGSTEEAWARNRNAITSAR